MGAVKSPEPKMRGQPVLEELARAKVNLTLRVLGRRADGYHGLDSIVAFGDVGDVVRLLPGAPTRVCVTGAFASEIVGENLAARALAMLQTAEPRLTLGEIAIEKRLPVAAGLGGGSADAAAVLRLVRLLNAELAAEIDWEEIALALGSDVLVCLGSRSCRMQGRGDVLTPLPYEIQVPAVLVNAREKMPADKTARMFKMLNADELDDADEADKGDAFVHFADGMNDLEVVAAAQFESVRIVLRRLRRMERARWARMSGAGPSCFAVFDTIAGAESAAKEIAEMEPSWWVQATTLA
jgi:4-diphosphocytidyl-2-C-methyl-D-erythritol kinase